MPKERRRVIRLDEDLDNDLVRLAELAHVSVSHVIRTAIRTYVKRTR